MAGGAAKGKSTRAAKTPAKTPPKAGARRGTKTAAARPTVAPGFPPRTAPNVHGVTVPKTKTKRAGKNTKTTKAAQELAQYQKLRREAFR